MKKFTAILLAFAMAATATNAQSKLTREQILAMSTDELSELPLDELMQAVETLGVSSVDELFALIMNKSVSSASKSEESSFTAPLSTTVITHDELRSYGVSTIEEAMRLIPGMIVSQKTNGIYDIQMRGLNNIPDNNMMLYTENNTTLLMVDGRNVHDYQIGAMSMSQLPISIEDVERIEVVRGACSALYGTNAMNGIINIVTRKPDAAKSPVSGSLQMGNQNTLTVDFALRSKVNDVVSLGVSANMQNRERPTGSLYVTPNDGYYLDVNDAYTSVTQGVSQETIGQAIANGELVKVSGSQLMTPDEINKLRQLYPNSLNPSAYDVYDVDSYEFSNVYNVVDNPNMSRRSFGINGYVSLTPAEDIRVDLTGGYSQDYELNTTLVEMPYSFTNRIFKKGYVNADARIKDLHVLANYSAGPMNYVVGRPGFKINNQQFFGTIEYDFHVGDLIIRPGFALNHVHDSDVKKDGDFSGFFSRNGKGTNDITSIAPSLRLDYRVNDWRFILAGRSDKTNKPDKWNTSVQAVVSKQFNENNFLRLGYGLGMRSANMVSSACNYTWNRQGMMAPNIVVFIPAKDADVTNIHNFELGYRVKPANNILVDAEVFYSRSTDYMSLVAWKSQSALPTAAVSGLMQTLGQYMTPETSQAIQDPEQLPSLIAQLNGMIGGSILSNFGAVTMIRGGNMPYEVHQYGVGINVDWIISSKLIAKLNFNVQKTLIDKYYPYNQGNNIKNQITNAVKQTVTSVQDIVMAVLGLNTDLTPIATTRTAEEFMACALSESDGDELQGWFHSLSQDEQANFLATMRNSWYGGQDVATYNGQTYENPIALYYALKYGISLEQPGHGQPDYFALGRSEQLEPQLKDKHEHKATPPFYGMAGLIWKPTTQLNFAAYANFMGERTYLTSLGEEKLNKRFTVNVKAGWKPTEQIEVFVNANNLFNNKKQEFIYSDKIGGIYTLGVNFGF